MQIQYKSTGTKSGISRALSAYFCPRKAWLDNHYYNNPDGVLDAEDVKDATLIGSLCHNTLEQFTAA